MRKPFYCDTLLESRIPTGIHRENDHIEVEFEFGKGEFLYERLYTLHTSTGNNGKRYRKYGSTCVYCRLYVYIAIYHGLL